MKKAQVWITGALAITISIALLVTMRQILDPFFNRSVVLLAENDAEGSFGLILNRFTDIEIATLLQGLEIEWGGDPTVQSRNGSVRIFRCRSTRMRSRLPRSFPASS